MIGSTLVPPIVLTSRHGNLVRDWPCVPRIDDLIDLPFIDVDEAPEDHYHRVMVVLWADDEVTVECGCER